MLYSKLSDLAYMTLVVIIFTSFAANEITSGWSNCLLLPRHIQTIQPVGLFDFFVTQCLVWVNKKEKHNKKYFKAIVSRKMESALQHNIGACVIIYQAFKD